jgi:predicted dehydrogenase
MNKVKIALAGIGGISQIVRIPTLIKMEDVELVAICDLDEAKMSFIADKYDIPRVYFDYQELLNKEDLDGVFVCTPNNMHYPMALASMELGVPTLVEKPLALNLHQAKRIAEKSRKTGTTLMIGMNNRFRDDAMVLKEFIDNNEIGEPYYLKTGWLRHWSRPQLQTWLTDLNISGGGVLMDMGIQLVDLALWLLNKPKIKNVRGYTYDIFEHGNVEDSALATIQTETDVVITIEVAWRMHLEKDMIYTNVFGRGGGAMMNPLRLYKEMHGKLVNVTPIDFESTIDVFKRSFEKEMQNFIKVIKGEEKPVTPVEDGVYLLEILDAIYISAKSGKQVEIAH